MSYTEWKDKASDFKKVDVRGVAGNFFQGLKKQAVSLPVGQGIEVIQSFDPLPLYEVMDMLGYERHTEKSADNEYHAYFYRMEEKDMLMKEAMAPIALKDKYVRQVYTARLGSAPEMLPGFMIFDTCEKVISDLRDIQADEKNVNDCAKDPHEVTHNPDMVRYFVISRVTSAEKPAVVEEDPFAELDTEPQMDYVSYMTGGEITASYIGVMDGD